MGLGNSVVDEYGNPLVLDTVSHALLPLELRKITSRYRMMSCCKSCMVGQYYQSTLNSYWLHHLSDLETEEQEMTSSTEEEKGLKSLAEAKHTPYAMEVFMDGLSLVKVPLNKKIQNVSYCIQCKSLVGFEDIGLTQIDCALGKCEKCGTCSWLAAEVELGDDNKKI